MKEIYDWEIAKAIADGTLDELDDQQRSEAEAYLKEEAPHWGDELAEYLEDNGVIPHQS